MDRRGELAFFLSRTIDIILSAVIIFAILAFTYALWTATHQGEKRVENPFAVLGDMIDGVIASPLEGPSSTRTLTLPFENNDKKPFDGTFFIQSSDGTWSAAFPSPAWYGDASMTKDRVNEIARMVNVSAVKRVCKSKTINNKEEKFKPCICRSTVKLDKTDSLWKAFQSIEECRSFDLPKGKAFMLLDFEQTIQAPGTNDYPKIYLNKEKCTDDRLNKLDVAVGASSSMVPSVSNTVCIIGNINAVAYTPTP